MDTRDPDQLTNAEVARLRDLTRQRRERHEAGRFVVEGVKLVAEVLRSELDVVLVCCDEDWQPAPDITAAAASRSLPLRTTNRRGIERIASTASPQPVVAEVAMPSATLADLEPGAPVLSVVDLNDPGNLGTLMRSATAAGFGGVICLGDTVDPFAPKVIRSAAGAIFRTPVVVERDAAAGLRRLGERGLTRYGTRMAQAVACDETDLTGPIAIVLGSEAHGLGDSYAELIDGWLRIPMTAEIESLNVAMAGTILTYEAARQRRSGTK